MMNIMFDDEYYDDDGDAGNGCRLMMMVMMRWMNEEESGMSGFNLQLKILSFLAWAEKVWKVKEDQVGGERLVD